MTVKTQANERPTPLAKDTLPNGELELDLTGPTARLVPRGCEPTWTHLVPLGSPGSADPIFCAHGFDGLASRFRPLSASVDGFRIVGLQVAGIDGLQPMHRTLDELANAYVKEMRSAHGNRPFVILGHAEGGVLAWELARRLKNQGEEIGALVLIDAVNPSVGLLERRMRAHLDGLSRRPVSHAVDQVGSAVRRRRRKRALNSPDAFSSEPVDAGVKTPVPLDIRMHRLRANTRTLLHDYSPEPFTGRVLYFESAAPADSHFHRSAVDDWRPLAPDLELVPLRSEPTTALADPHAARLGRLLSSWLATP